MTTRCCFTAVLALALTAAMLLSPSAAGAAQTATTPRPKPAIELGAPFADNAIVQRQMPVPVWGWSKPGTKITVRFAGQTKSATAGKDGKWMLKLDPLKANATPQEVLVSDNKGKEVILKNILVGEVWMASGQSNMQWRAGKSSSSLIIKALRAKGKLPPIREGKVTNVFSSLHPIEHAEGAWSDGSDFSDYSAIAFAFAYELYKELQVPIGILNCSFSSTSIEAWVPRIGFRDGGDEYTRSVYQRILQSDPTTPEHKAAWGKFYRDLEKTIEGNAERIRNGQPARAVSTQTPGNLRGNRDASWLFNARLNPVIPYAIRGTIWNQGYANMGAGLTYYHNLHSLVRGWRICWDRPDLPVYSHQFYCPRKVTESLPSIGSTAEMRLGTWLARDIPNTGMASQIDIQGAVHYYNKAVPGQRLARHALKNQYAKMIPADGPMFKSYKVDGNRLIVQFDHADGGLVVGETGTNARGIANPKVIEDGDDKVKLFYLADENRVWHPAAMKIDGARVILTSPKVKAPRGISYGAGGVGSLPNLYNRALLPATPFIYYDHELVTSTTWPDEALKIAGVEPDPSTVGKRYEYRKMPLLSTQFRDNAVLQAGVPVTIWGSAVHNWGYEADGEAVIKFSLAGIEKTIPVTPGMREWQLALPPMEASAEPRTLKVVFEIDGEMVHERVCSNIVFGDVWYVAAPPLGASFRGGEAPAGMVRVMTRKAKRSTSPRPSRYSVCVSTTPKNRFASEWRSAGDRKMKNAGGGFPGALGERIHAKTRKPVGIIFMQGGDQELKSWIPVDCLKRAPSLMADYKNLAVKIPGTPYYNANVRRYIADWKKYWGEFVPQLMAAKKLPDGAPGWGAYPSFTGSVTSDASQSYNVLVHSFTPASFNGVIFLSSPKMAAKGHGANFGPELSVLANCWKDRFAGEDPHFFYTIPSKALAPKITRPNDIKGKSTPCEMSHWLTAKREGRKMDERDAAVVHRQLLDLIQLAVKEAYE